jgi:hypothetical protein
MIMSIHSFFKQKGLSAALLVPVVLALIFLCSSCGEKKHENPNILFI